MYQLSYAPQTIPADRLNEAIELDTGFIVNLDGSVEDSGNHAPDVWGEQGHADPDTGELGWEFFSRGYTGQYGYNGPEMHESEFLGGRMATDILATPGEYALCAVRYDCEEDNCGELWDPVSQRCAEFPHIESWVVLNRA